MSNQNRAVHFLFSAIPAWGKSLLLSHVRPFSVLAARLVKENKNAMVTFITGPKVLERTELEISAEFGILGVSELEARRRLRVLSTFQSESDNLVELMGTLAETYRTAYECLVHEKPITCAVTGKVFGPVPVPAVAILDFLAYPLLQATREVSGRSIPIAALISGHASSIIRIFGPEHFGGLGDFGAKIDAEAARLGVAPEEIGDKACRILGAVVKIAGLPAMYDYEFFPQKNCDEVLVATPEVFEPESVAAMRSWFSEWEKGTYIIGPLLPISFGTGAQSARGSGETASFLDRILSSHGQKSLLYISFGTLFWPAIPEYMDELIDALIEKNVPFIVSVASPLAQISEESRRKTEASGIGIFGKWTPQQFILSHPATGWFLSHCGHNSVMESLACGIPLIAWPIETDQPGAAAHLTENLDVAFELIEVRSGQHGLKPMLRSGRVAKGTREAVAAELREVLDACRGARGAELRRNAEAMKGKFTAAWQDNGDSRKEWHKFQSKYL
ncbi:hypothetical protein CVT26_005096 [Gymnopilus dilepis]|uniref:Glycosyltransferase family 1 protein n=1 Tax=Gymnopilus dilepis TaxID=231916 RepID=A0A409Y063_9AGAR|nr:hypothetical protein CVT26_005096 [Gymnopilus dilepis]